MTSDNATQEADGKWKKLKKKNDKSVTTTDGTAAIVAQDTLIPYIYGLTVKKCQLR